MQPAKNPKSKTTKAAPAKKVKVANPLFQSAPRSSRVGGDVRVIIADAEPQ
jgi:hypothetical protein